MRFRGLAALLAFIAVAAHAQSPSPTPSLQWSQSLAVPGAINGSAVDIVTDANGDAVVTGWVGDFPHRDLVVARLQGSGAVRWLQRYDGAAHGNDEGTSVSVDPAGSVYVGGIEDFLGAQQSVLLKYDQDGTLLWRRTYPDGSSNAIITKPAFDAANNLYFATFGGGAFTLTSLDPSGNVRFARPLPGGFGYTRTVIAPDGTLVATGGRFATHVVKMDLAGNVIWQATGSFIGDGTGSEVAFGPAGEIFVVTGEVLTKFTASGTEAWHYVYAFPPSPHGCPCDAQGLVVDSGGFATLTARTFARFVSTLEVVRFDPTGAVVWRDFYPPIGPGVVAGAGGSGILLAAGGAVDVVGAEFASDGASRFFVARYAADGTRTMLDGVVPGLAVTLARVGPQGLYVGGQAAGDDGRLVVARYDVDGPAGADPTVLLPVPTLTGPAMFLLVALLCGLTAAARERTRPARR